MGLRPPMVNLTHDLWVKPANGGRRPIMGGPRGGGAPLAYSLAQYFPSTGACPVSHGQCCQRGEELNSVRICCISRVVRRLPECRLYPVHSGPYPQSPRPAHRCGPQCSTKTTREFFYSFRRGAPWGSKTVNNDNNCVTVDRNDQTTTTKTV